MLGYSLILLHRYDEAAAEFSKLPEDNAQAQTGRAIIAALTGNMRASDQLITQMQQAQGDLANFQYAEVYAQRKDANAAIGYLKRAVEVHDTGLAFLKSDPFLDPIRGDQRLAAIIAELDFPS